MDSILAFGDSNTWGLIPGSRAYERYPYIVDAVDTVTAKIELILRTQREGIPIISAMGAGNKLDSFYLACVVIIGKSG